MFEYARSRHAAVTRLGQFVAHGIVKPIKGFAEERWYEGERDKLRSVEDLNGLDRFEIARNYLNTKQGMRFLSEIGAESQRHDLSSTLIKDMALFFDIRIPDAYFKWHDQFPQIPQVATVEETGLIYHLPESPKLAEEHKSYIEKISSPERPASEKQLKYLKNLMDNAGYVLKGEIKDLTITEASQFISFFVDDQELPDELSRLLEYDI
ncbi:hypothetical protein A616_25125 [Brevibacillus brevis X23]|nr:hypothetical protein A616_25125 [Brevibacillus brevis X23]